MTLLLNHPRALCGLQNETNFMDLIYTVLCRYILYRKTGYTALQGIHIAILFTCILLQYK